MTNCFVIFVEAMARFGVKPFVLSTVGKDVYGKMLLHKLKCVGAVSTVESSSITLPCTNRILVVCVRIRFFLQLHTV